MKKIRIGKDISVRWPILTNGEAQSLDGRDLKLFIKSQYNVAKEIAFSTEDNIVFFTYPGTEQQMLGIYKLTLWENYGKRGQTAVDCCEAFQLVSCTCKEEPDCGGFTPEEVALEPSTIEVGIGGAGGSAVKVVQELGTSTTDVMSQDAVTRELRQMRQDIEADTDAALQDAKEYTNDRETAIRTDMATENTDVRALIASRIGLPEFNAQDYTLTFTTQNGATVVIDLPLETMGLDYDAETKEMIYTAADGSKRHIPLVDFVDIYVGSIGPEIQVMVDSGNVIRATLLESSVSWEKLTSPLQQKIDSKVDKIPGKGLSTEDFTTSEKEKLAIIDVDRDLVPAGGTTGQVLTKTSDGAAWQDAAGGGELPFKVATIDFQGGRKTTLSDAEIAALDTASMLVVKNSIYNNGGLQNGVDYPLVLSRSYQYANNFYLWDNGPYPIFYADYQRANKRIIIDSEKLPAATLAMDDADGQAGDLGPADTSDSPVVE